jgi:hypothetical protein
MAYGSVKVDSIVTSTKTVTVDNLLEASLIGTAVQAYDADTAKLDVVQTFTAVQTLTDPAIIGTITEDTHAFGSSPDFEIDPANGSIQLLLLTGNHKPKGTNFQNGKKILLFVSDGSGEFPYTIDWTDSTFGSGNTGSGLTGVQWLDGAAPQLATADYTCIELTKAFDQVRGALLNTDPNLRRLPQNSKTSAYTLVASDTGKHISITTGGVTIPASVMSIGDVVTIFNNSASAQSIVQDSGVTLRKADSTSTGNLSLSNYGIATVLCVAADTFVISGVGLS